ncbi:GAF domain-containing protein [Spirulina subsalsa FACHB-351]|uniref:GAF domain-containing protein n=1 Tax=Spirulina subsalsa FACHB-351 TaxID=234711 RepID=A0ABT3L6S8_9CYAN|nr:GAF domain-containing protein [Spirulina subsalsa]MCW6037207.1 GAF domain-containing protein [Spirulina subsalsa FACHB-351]
MNSTFSITPDLSISECSLECLPSPLFRQTREQILRNLSHSIQNSLELRLILKDLVKDINHWLLCDRTLIYRLDTQQGGFVMCESHTPDYTSLLDWNIRLPLWGSSAVLKPAGFEAQVIPDLAQIQLDSDERQILQLFNIKSQVLVPLLLRQNPWGLLILHQCCDVREWQSWEVEGLQDLAVAVSIAIQQSYLYHQLQWVTHHCLQSDLSSI